MGKMRSESIVFVGGAYFQTKPFLLHEIWNDVMRYLFYMGEMIWKAEKVQYQQLRFNSYFCKGTNSHLRLRCRLRTSTIKAQWFSIIFRRKIAMNSGIPHAGQTHIAALGYSRDFRGCWASNGHLRHSSHHSQLFSPKQHFIELYPLHLSAQRKSSKMAHCFRLGNPNHFCIQRNDPFTSQMTSLEYIPRRSSQYSKRVAPNHPF